MLEVSPEDKQSRNETKPGQKPLVANLSHCWISRVGAEVNTDFRGNLPFHTLKEEVKFL